MKNSEKRDDDLVRLDALNDQLSRIPEARSRLIDAYTEGTIDKPAFKDKMATLDARKTRLAQERDSLLSGADQGKRIRLRSRLI